MAEYDYGNLSSLHRTVAEALIHMVTETQDKLTGSDLVAFRARVYTHPLDLEVRCNGVELDFIAFVERVHGALDVLVEKRAAALLRERCDDVVQQIDKLQEAANAALERVTTVARLGET